MRTAEALTTLLACAYEQIEPKVCRQFWNPGANAPHDNCEVQRRIIDGETVVTDGQLWVAHTTGTAGWPYPTDQPINCATPFAETIEVGIVRCAKSKLKDGADPIPPAQDVTDDAIQQEADRNALKQAILCCWGVDGKDMLPPVWEPIEPQGGCVGGTWTIIIRDASCVCPAEES